MGCSRVCKAKNAVVLVALLLCGLMLHAQTAKSGITGVVIQVGHPGPTRAGEPPSYYTGPLEVIRMADKQRVATTKSDKNGAFTVELPPDSYFITQSDPRLSRIYSEVIVVEKGKMTRVKLYADNGMR
jgi:hypothetical protein